MSTYRQLNKELERILDRLQSNDLDIDDMLKEYQLGIVTVEQLEKYLKSAQNKITKLKPTNVKKRK